MKRITIEVADDGSVTVVAEMDGAEPQTMEYANSEEAASAVLELLAGDEPAAEPAMPAEGEMDAGAMWDEEAAKRPPQANLMA